MDSETLAARARAGDEAAFTALVELHQEQIYRLALRMTGSREDAADLTQETFLRAWRGLASFHGESAFSTWLYRLCSNACVDFLRRRARRPAVSLTVAEDDDGEGERIRDIPDDRPSPEEEAERSERLDALRTALARLSDDHREILVLRELEGLSYAEIADTLGLEEGTVKSRIARARLALRKLLLESGNFSAFSSSIQ